MKQGDIGNYTVPYKYRYSLSKDTERTTDGKYVVYHRGERIEIGVSSVEFYGNITSEPLTRDEFNDIVKGTKGIVDIVGKFKGEEMDNKYYTPSIEEFHVNFEYEFKHLVTNDWIKCRVGEVDDWDLADIYSEIDKYRVRVKYLDKADIEELGFGGYIPPHEYDHTWSRDSYILKAWFHHEIPVVRIMRTPNTFLFHGNVKNKSELKRILKQLDINFVG